MDEVKQQARQALAELYSYHDTDLRFTRRLDAVRDYIDTLEAAVTPATVPEPTAVDAPADAESVQTDQPASAGGEIAVTDQPIVGDDGPEIVQAATRKGKKQ
jgi:hypothetical protein